jgi:2-dehydro-3-deoxyphosphogluconate aldolase/(4S)-4-hydroxy-2-oxoglutarate aldolase
LDIKKFKQLPVLGILRGIEADALEPLIAAMESSGLKTIEITMNTKGAVSLIRKACALSKGRLTIGAGTVLDKTSLRSALDSGATFIVTPVLVKDCMRYCVKNKIPVFPGALTPSEIRAAWESGATMVKVFPSNFFGPEYFKEVKGPFQDAELLACGGVTPANLGRYFANGASAVSFGASVFKKEWMAQKKFKAIEESIKKYVREFSVLQHKGIKT